MSRALEQDDANRAPPRVGDRSIAYVVNGYPRRSETFIASEMHRLEAQGVRLRTYAIKPGDTGDPHPVVGQIRATPEYLQSRTPVPGTPVHLWLARNLPALLPALGRAAARWPFGILRAGAFAFDQAMRARRAEWSSSPLTYIKEFFLAVALADRVLAAPDVAHLHAAFAHRTATVTWMASMITGLPFSFTGHAKDIYVADLNPAGLLRRKLLAASFVVTCTHANRRHLLALAPEARVHTIYHGLNADFAALVRAGSSLPVGPPASDGCLRILGVGRLVIKKGFDLLVEACAILRDQGLDVDLRIIGGFGEHADDLRSLIAARSLEAQAELVGPRSQAEIYAELRAADVFCLPCRVMGNGDRDGIPNVLVEAMSIGVPVVTTPVSGIPELVEDGRSALVVAQEDPEALAVALRRLHDHPELARRLGAAGQGVVLERFDGDRLATSLATLFRASAL